jgi:hypothetical protein
MREGMTVGAGGMKVTLSPAGTALQTVTVLRCGKDELVGWYLKEFMSFLALSGVRKMIKLTVILVVLLGWPLHSGRMSSLLGRWSK